MIAVATAAVREARDGPAFCDQVEARDRAAAARGERLGGGAAGGQGGAARLAGRRRAGLRHGRRLDGAGAGVAAARSHACATSPLGPLQLADIPDADKREKAIRKGVKALRKAVPEHGAAALPGRRVVAGDRPARHGAGRAIR